jgi:DNA-binding beta-propeller fold protein YncE
VTLLPAGGSLNGLVVSPDGRTVYLASSSGGITPVTPVSVASDQPGRSFRTAGLLNSALDAPLGVMLSPDGRRVYAAVSAGLETFSAGDGTGLGR